MKTYEVTYLTLGEEGYDASTISETLAKHGCKIVSVHPWGARRKLAYPINKQDQAFYTTVVFDADASAVLPIENALKLNNDVLRALVTTFEPGYFQRMANTTAPTSGSEAKESEKPKAEEVKEETPSEEVAPIEEVTEEAITEETPAAEEKPKRRTTKNADKEDSQALDEKIDALLNEDITK
ncbi:MAG TPA: 30S ribosomal protein S6 [Patescibacteria group bacterium]